VTVKGYTSDTYRTATGTSASVAVTNGLKRNRKGNPMTQLDLFVKPTTEAEQDADKLQQYLRGQDWQSAAKIGAYLRWTDRRVRAAASASNGAVLSGPGSPGYKLAAETSVAEYTEKIDRPYAAQIRVMGRRLIQMRKAVHGNRSENS